MSGCPYWRQGTLQPVFHLLEHIPKYSLANSTSQASGRGGHGNIVGAPATDDLESQSRPSLDSANGIPLVVIQSRSSGRGGAGNGVNEHLSVADLERLEREEIRRVKHASTVSSSACVSPPFLELLTSEIHSPSRANLVVRAGRGGFDATPAPTADSAKQEQDEQAAAARTLSADNVPYAVYRSAGRGGAGNAIPPVAENVAGPSGSGSSSYSLETQEPAPVVT